MRGIKFVPDGTKIDFIGKRYIALTLSAILLLGSCVFLVKDGLNFGIDFTGGTLIEIKTPETPDLTAMRGALNELDVGAISIQEFGSPNDLLIRLPQQKGDVDAQNAVLESVRGAIDGQFSEAVDYRRTEYVGPQVGEELKKQGLMAVIFSLLGIMAYVSFRFEWQFGVAALGALAHDSLATIGLFAITHIEFSLSTVAAILMIAGYSINDTVVVFDRVRENMRKYKKMSLGDLYNLSVNETLSRTLLTSGTTMLALVALYAFGGAVIRDFVIALLFGIFVGTYSSVFVAAPLLMFMKIRRGSGEE